MAEDNTFAEKREHLAAAKEHEQSGSILRAIVALRQASKIDPRDLTIYRDLSRLYLQQGLFEEAIMQLDVLVAYLFKQYGSVAPTGVSRERQQAVAGDAYIDEIKARIGRGEGATTEFKSTLRYNIRDERHDAGITFAVIRAVAAFLNTDGGVLFVGVGDDRSILGVVQDGFGTHDRLKLFLFDSLRSNLGVEATTHVSADLVTIDGKDVVVIETKRSAKLVFARKGNTEVCFVRTGPASVELPASRIVEYAAARERQPSRTVPHAGTSEQWKDETELLN